ncbi:MAG: HEAT repeat domain-containing protein [Methanomicrobiales archaeon]
MKDTPLPAVDNVETEEYEKKFRHYISMLEDPDPGRRWKAAESLARLGDTRAVDPLIHTLSDEDWRVRQKTAWALGYLGDPAAIPALRRAYRSDLEGVREMITEAITMITMKEQDSGD